MDLYRFPSRSSHFLEVQRFILDKREIPNYNHKHDHGRDSTIDKSMDCK